jgi:nicotinamide-nucleotide amidase
MNDLDSEISALAIRLVEIAKSANLRLVTAESCTGGLVGGAITRVPGSSDAYDRGYITYSNTAKIDSLKVDPDLIAEFGAVSRDVAREMALGARAESGADIAVSITGIAGPGGSEFKPAGLVWFGLATSHERVETLELNLGDIGRDEVRQAAVRQALELLISGVEHCRTA